MIRSNNNEIDYIHYHAPNGRMYDITYVYNKGIQLWELIIGFIFSKDNYCIQSSDGYMIKTNDL